MKLHIFVTLILSIAVAGLLLTSFASSDEGDNGYVEYEHEWEMFSQRVSGDRTGDGIATGVIFVYNKRTGEVYRFFPNISRCGNGAPHGCFVPISGNQ